MEKEKSAVSTNEVNTSVVGTLGAYKTSFSSEPSAGAWRGREETDEELLLKIAGRDERVVFIVIKGPYIIAVFSNKEKAEEYKGVVRSAFPKAWCWVEEWEVDARKFQPPPETGKGG